MLQVMERQDSSLSNDGAHSGRGSTSLRFWLVLAGFLIIIGGLLLTEHRAHVLGLLIWLTLLACPLMHLFMHGGHDHHDHSNSQRNNQS